MKMIFTSIKSRALALCLTVCALFAANTASAYDLTELTASGNSQTLTVKVFTDYYLKVTAEVAGTLEFSYYGGHSFGMYSDDTFSEDAAILDYTAQRADDGTSLWQIPVEKDSVYYFKFRTIDSSTELGYRIITLGTPPTLSQFYPGEAENYTLEVTNLGYISFKTDMDIVYDGVTLSYVDENDETQSQATTLNGPSFGYYNITVKYILYDWLTLGLVQPNDTITLTITGLCAANDATALYNNDGVFTMKFTAPSVPVELADDGQSYPGTFYSWWDKGDTGGIATLTFTGDLLPFGETAANGKTQTASGTIGYGDREDEDGNYYEEDITNLISINGNVLTVDFTDKSRTRKDMLPGTDVAYENMLIIVHYVRDKNGEYCYSEGSGSVASYQASVPYVDLTETTGIKGVASDGAASGIYYNVAGQRISQPTKGLYITDGKKVVVK